MQTSTRMCSMLANFGQFGKVVAHRCMRDRIKIYKRIYPPFPYHFAHVTIATIFPDDQIFTYRILSDLSVLFFLVEQRRLHTLVVWVRLAAVAARRIENLRKNLFLKIDE